MIDHSVDPNPPEPPAERRAAVKRVLDRLHRDADADARSAREMRLTDDNLRVHLNQLHATTRSLADACAYLLAELEDVEKRTGVDR